MDEKEQNEIAQIVQKVIQVDRAKQHSLDEFYTVRHIRRRVIGVVIITTVVVVTHQFTHIEPIGRLGEMTVGALFSWFFEQATKRSL